MIRPYYTAGLISFFAAIIALPGAALACTNEQGIMIGVNNMQANCNGRGSPSDCYNAAATFRRVLTKYEICPEARGLANYYIQQTSRVMARMSKLDRNAVADDQREVDRIYRGPSMREVQERRGLSCPAGYVRGYVGGNRGEDTACIRMPGAAGVPLMR